MPQPADTKHVESILPHDEKGPAQARATVTEAMAGLPADAVDTARLLVTELVTNSVKHTPTQTADDIRMRLAIRGDTLRVEVRDRGERSPIIRSEEQRRDGSGFGLYLVDQLASEWGIGSADPGHVVWFELGLR